jgi:DNA sulfur modification protein DndC
MAPSTEIPSSPAQRSITRLIEDIESLKQEIQDLYCFDAVPWIIGYSGGKDSSCVLQMVWLAISSLPIEKRNKKIYVLTTDTLVENPIVSAWVKQSLSRLDEEAKRQGLPFEAHLLCPDVQETFWVNLIGKGYPAPRHMFRWCTERLKINPANRFIQNVVRSNGEVIIVLGTRKAESSRRASVMDEHEIGHVNERLNTNSLKSSLLFRGSMPNSLVYSPIADWRDDEVWLYLMQFPNPWNHSNKELFTMYRGATEDNECPFVIDTSTPSCGDSRFGCWVCTLVNQDKSMTAMIQNDEEKSWMQPLLDLRNHLDVRDDHDRRDFRRLTGRVQLFERSTGEGNGSTEVIPIPGPYTRHWREEWLRQVLRAQQLARQNAPADMKDIQLISIEELSEIRRIWREEKHEFDDSLPRIYREETGQIFRDPRPSTAHNVLGVDEWEILQDICGDDTMHLELVTKLLGTERQHQTSLNRTKIYKDLEKCFETAGLDKEAAIDRAHQIRNLKQASDNADLKSVKKQLQKQETTIQQARAQKQKHKPKQQTQPNPTSQPSAETWADLKFKQPIKAMDPGQ